MSRRYTHVSVKYENHVIPYNLPYLTFKRHNDG